MKAIFLPTENDGFFLGINFTMNIKLTSISTSDYIDKHNKVFTT